MKRSLKSQLIEKFITVIFITTLICAIMGTFLINKGTMGQVQDRVKASLNSAREVLGHSLENCSNIIYLTSTRQTIERALLRRDRGQLKAYLEDIREKGRLDFLDIADEKGRVVLRASNPRVYGDMIEENDVVRTALWSRTSVSSIETIPYETIGKEGMEIMSRCSLRLRDKSGREKEPIPTKTDALVLISASPILGKEGRTVGVLYGGEVLNQKNEVVDKIRDILFQNEKYRGKDIGGATLFLRDIRISTNFKDEGGFRAVGSHAPEEVVEEVLRGGRQWVGKADIIGNWYLTAYVPMRNMKGAVIGILAVGLLEQGFSDLRREALTIFLGITLIGVALSVLIATFLADTVVKPVNSLVQASKRVSEGDFSAKVETRSANEIGTLEKTFNLMAASLKERAREIKRLNEQHLMRSEKLASIGRLAAGIAHEINNPLTSVLTFSSLLLRKSEESQREKLEIIVKETTRCREIVKGLLNFARQNEPRKSPADINQIIDNALSLTKNHMKVNEKRITVLKELRALPSLQVDTNQILEVFVNIIINAADAMPDGGELKITSEMLEAERSVEIKITDSGHGISAEDLEKVFDPFFTTKEAGKGTGLGLAVTYGIIDKHNGTIDVESEVGKGTTFIIKLPME